MIEALNQRLAGMLPLLVREATYEDPTLSLVGDGWVLSTSSSWRVINGGVLSYGWSHPEAVDRVWDLRGQSIVSVTCQSPLMRGDPAVELSGGDWLEIFSDFHTDPWVFELPGFTFVGSPSDPAYVR